MLNIEIEIEIVCLQLIKPSERKTSLVIFHTIPSYWKIERQLKTSALYLCNENKSSANQFFFMFLLVTTIWRRIKNSYILFFMLESKNSCWFLIEFNSIQSEIIQ